MNLLSQLGNRIGRTVSRFNDEDRALLERLGKLNERDGFTLTHCLSVAAERFDDDARTMLQQKAASEAILAEQPGARMMFHPAACEQLAKQFERQAADARALIAVIEGDDEEEAEEAA